MLDLLAAEELEAEPEPLPECAICGEPIENPDETIKTHFHIVHDYCDYDERTTRERGPEYQPPE